MKKLIWNVYFTDMDQSTLIDELYNHSISDCDTRSIAFVNPHTQVSARKNASLLEKLNSFDYVLCDGVGTQLASRLYKKSVITRLSGPSFFKSFSEHEHSTDNKLKYFFLGSSDQVLSKIEEKMAILYPHISVVGTYSPPMGEFTEADNQRMLDAINGSGCTVLWVGLTAPKQEEWISQHLSAIDTKLAAGIGAEFDYFAGAKKRPPAWISNIGFQWLHRLITQPNVWKRTVISAPVFVFNVLLHRFSFSGE